MNRGGVIRGNILRQADEGMIVREGARDVLLRHNTFDQVVIPLAGEGAPEAQFE